MPSCLSLNGHQKIANWEREREREREREKERERGEREREGEREGGTGRLTYRDKKYDEDLYSREKKNVLICKKIASYSNHHNWINHFVLVASNYQLRNIFARKKLFFQSGINYIQMIQTYLKQICLTFYYKFKLVKVLLIDALFSIL